MEKFKGLYHQNMPSIKASEGLTSILNQQINPKLKVGLGYEEGSSSNHPSNIESVDQRDYRHERNRPLQRRQMSSK
jgi:hypothetical protein